MSESPEFSVPIQYLNSYYLKHNQAVKIIFNHENRCHMCRDVPLVEILEEDMCYEKYPEGIHQCPCHFFL